MRHFLTETREKIPLAVVGGSDLTKIVEQLGDSQQDVLKSFDYVFSENGLVGFHGQVPYPIQTIADEVGEVKLQRFINFALRYIADLDLPVKRGTFIEFRKGMLNVSPIGRSCSQSERDQFVAFNRQHHILDKFAQRLRNEFTEPEYNLTISIGGQISVDVFPRGWDKSFCLQYLTDHFETIHFFGDKTAEGGNDHEIFADSRTIGHTVTGPKDTIAQIQQLLLTLGL